MLLLAAVAYAAAPSGHPADLDVGSGAVERMVASPDGSLIAGRSGSALWVLDVDGWEVHTAQPCSVTGVAFAPQGSGQQIWVACQDGRLRPWHLAGGELVPVTDTSGSPVAVQIGAGALLGLWSDGEPTDPYLYAVEDQAERDLVHVYAPGANLLDGDVWPSFATPPFTLADGLRDAAEDLGVLYLGHGGRRATMISFASGGVSYTNLAGVALYDVDAIAGGGNKLWAADTDLGAVFEFRPVLGTFGPPLSGFAKPRALAASLEPGDEWLFVGGDGAWIHPLQNGMIVDIESPAYAVQDSALALRDVVASDGYAFAGAAGGALRVFTARPWVEMLAITPGQATEGDTVTLTFQVDRPSAWELRLNGTRTGGGARVASGSTTTAGEGVTVELTVDASWIEGANQLYAIATTSTQLSGHARATIAVDTPPDPPALNDGNLRFANQALILEFDGIPDADLDRYELWVADAPWDPADYPVGTGGPPGPEGLSTPIAVPSVGGARVVHRIEPLHNDVTYYIGVRAYDAAGAESAMSQVIQGTPERDLRASDLAGERGGSCATGGGAAGWAGALGLAALLGWRTRSRRVGMAAALLGALGLGAPAGAAEPDQDATQETPRKRKRADRGDLTPQWGNLELRYGGFTSLRDDNIKAVYGPTGHNMLQFEFGPQLFRLFELDVQAGLYQELANTVSAGGDASSVKTMLTWFPLGLSGTFRLQILDEQILVPHARLGMDYVLWNELTDNAAGGKDRISGSKMGHHYAFGASLLLDVFAPGRASLLEAQTGVNDTYITFEWRRQNVDSRKLPWAPAKADGFDFSGSLITIGLKLDY